MTAERQLSDFEGHWKIARSIIQADGARAQFSGTARFVHASQGGLDYFEDGTLQLPDGVSMHATRRYHWAEGLVVSFEDGRYFHTVPALGGEAHHLCPPDDYWVSYAFDAWPLWRTTWQVRGPRKDYQMISTYTRA